MFKKRKVQPESSKSTAHALGQARSFDPGVRMDAGAPLPHVFSSGSRTVVLFHSGLEPNPAWDGKTVTVIDPQDDDERHFAWMLFDGVMACLFGPPNDEALHVHPLWGHGLEFYSFHTVADSGWVANLQDRNRVHPYHREEAWKALTHFIITFHDETLEVIAKHYEVGTIETDFKSAIEFITGKLMS